MRSFVPQDDRTDQLTEKNRIKRFKEKRLKSMDSQIISFYLDLPVRPALVKLFSRHHASKKFHALVHEPFGFGPWATNQGADNSGSRHTNRGWDLNNLIIILRSFVPQDDRTHQLTEKNRIKRFKEKRLKSMDSQIISFYLNLPVWPASVKLFSRHHASKKFLIFNS